MKRLIEKFKDISDLSGVSVDDSATETDIRIAIRKEAENLYIDSFVDDVSWSEKRGGKE